MAGTESFSTVVGDTARENAAFLAAAYLRYTADQSRAVAYDAGAAPFARVVARAPSPAPWGIAVNGEGLVIASNVVSGSVTLFNAVTHQVLDTIPLGDMPNPIAFSPDGKLAYIGDQRLGEVFVLDVARRQVIDQVSVRLHPISVVRSKDGTRLYLGMASVSSNSGAVQELLIPSLTLGKTVFLGGSYVNGVAIDSSGTRLYATDWRGGTLFELGLPTLEVRQSWHLGGVAQDVAVTPDGSKVLVADETGYFHDVDVAAGTWQTLPTAFGGFDFADAPAIQLTFSAHSKAAALQQFNRATGRLTGPFSLPQEPRRGAVYWPTRTLIVTDFAGNSVAFLER